MDNSTHIENPHFPCPSRWTVSTKAIFAIINNYKALYTTILSCTAKEATVTSVRSTAAGHATKSQKFSTHLGLQFAINIFIVCEQVAITLQKPSVTARTSFGQFYEQQDKKVTSVDTITLLFCSDEAMVQMNLLSSNVLHLLQIYLFALMSAASGERTFSSQRRVKTYLS